MSRLRQRFARLEQAIQPGGRFFVMRPDPTLDLDEQIEAYRSENGVTARDILVIRPILAPESQPHPAASRGPQKGNRHALPSQ
jgi:hypothetical protein